MISVVIPVYNEEKTIGKTITQIANIMQNKQKEKYEIIVVDDGSTDRTNEIALAAYPEKVNVFRHEQNIGYGAALKTGIRKAKGEIIVMTDADYTYPLEKIVLLIKSIKNYDMVVGARRGKIVNIPLYRTPAKWFLRILANYLTGKKIPDLNSGLRTFRKKDALKFLRLIPDGFSFTTTITLAYLSSGMSIKYIPINYYARKGKSKISPIKDFANFIFLIVRTIAYFSPLKVFLPVSALLFLAALSLLVFALIFGILHGTTIAILVVSSIQISLFGILTDVIVKSRVEE